MMMMIYKSVCVCVCVCVYTTTDYTKHSLLQNTIATVILLLFYPSVTIPMHRNINVELKLN